MRLEYGRNGLDVELPDESVVGVLKLNTSPPLSDPAAAVAAALADPISTRPLMELARGRRDACIVVCDVTRPVPNSILLPPILESLEAAGITRDRVTLLIATGTHRPNMGAELDAILGPNIARSVKVVNHVCTDPASHIDLGLSPNGVPVKLDRAYVEADIKITVGLIEPHFMAGYSGGRKLVMPGLAALETVQAWHSPRFLDHPLAMNGVVAGNPVHEEALTIARLVRPDMIVDVSLDEANRITGVFAGDLEAAWLEGVQSVASQVHVSVPEPVDIVITTCAGAPLDATFYQAVKGMVGALPIVKPGGTIVIASSCSEGVGSDHFQRLLFDNDCLETLTEAMRDTEWTFVPDQWEVGELAKALRHATVTCVCDGISSEVLAQCFVEPANTVEEGVQAALSKHGANATIAVIPKGPYVIPSVAM